MAEIFYFYVQDDRRILFPKLEDIMQEDHKVATWRFRIPKVLNEIDMSDWAWWFVFVNSKGQEFSPSLTLVDDPDEPDKFSIADYDIDYGISKFPGGFEFSLEAINADQGGEILNEWHTRTYNHKVTKTLQGNQAEFAETESDIISALIVEIQDKYTQLVGGATPEPVQTMSQMTNPKVVYLLTTDGNWYYHNGNTFVPGGKYGEVSATPEEIEGYIDDWLDEHPGATTTIQDGAVTEPKLADALKPKVINGYITPEQYGAVGNGQTDDLTAFQNAITAMSDGDALYLPAKKYLLSNTLTISKSITIFGDGTLYVTHANPVLKLDGAENAVIDIAKIQKESRVFDYEEGSTEYSIAVILRNCAGCNVYIHNITNTTTGFVLVGDGASVGSHYNQLQCDEARTFTGIEIIRTSNGGWVNGNRVNAFRWMVNTWFDNENLVPGYMIKSISYATGEETEPYKNNGNYFEHLVAEYGAHAADYPILLCRLDYARGYTLNFDRIEISAKNSSLTENAIYFTNSQYCAAFIWFSLFGFTTNVGNLATDHNLVIKKRDFESVSFSGVRSILSSVTLNTNLSYITNWFQIVKNSSTKSVRIFGELTVNADLANLSHLIEGLPTCRQGWGTMILTPSITETQWQAAGTVTHYKLSITSGRTFLANVGVIPAGTHLFLDFEYLISEDDL